MDGDRFDALTRALGGARSRRQVLRAVAGGLAAAVAGVARPVPGHGTIRAARCCDNRVPRGTGAGRD